MRNEILGKLLNHLEVEKYVQSSCSDNCIHHYNIEILNLFDPELQLSNTKPVIKNKLRELLNGLKKFRVQTILILDYKKRNHPKKLPFVY